ncbi:MAG TPA: phosphoenolpyruvate--protein phosphotransferase [Ktedonobacteraceae bacterium]|nr:phosphoenolpyruvate--protein phosphotransferase [Ktedonobacteraceae bacterium]
MTDNASSSVSPVKVMAISPGVAIGPVRLYKAKSHAIETTTIHPEQVRNEQVRLQQAIGAATQELRELSERVARTVGRSEADIFEAQQLILEDPELLAETARLIAQEYLSAAAALQQVAEGYAQELEALENETLAARATDVRDVVARAIRHLQSGEIVAEPGNDDMPVLVVAYDLTPSDTAVFNPETILGICTVVGGPTTHAAIIARALEIPAIADFDAQLLETLQNGQQIAIDGAKGLLYLQLADGQQEELQSTMRQQQRERKQRRARNHTLWRMQPASTADGYAVQVFANVGDVESARAAAELGAEGIGLLRTEFLFAGRPVFPDEEEQFDSYVALFQAFAGRALFGKTIIARTLDAGADKPFPALELLIGAMQEANPALGLRGARIHLVHKELLRQQLRALLRAAAAANIQLSIMFPMIATVEEARRLRALYTGVRHELELEGVMLAPDTQVGIMVETPAAAVMAEALAREVDFFSIGANDLFQYTMAADRANGRVTGMFGLLEPAVWRLIAQVVRAGERQGKLVALCGELAADPRIGPLLAGLGVQELSMSPAAVATVKAELHQQTRDYWRQRAQALLKAETAQEMNEMLQVPIMNVDTRKRNLPSCRDDTSPHFRY